MNLHEYQAKALFTQAGIPVPPGVVVHKLGDLREVYARLSDNAWAVKAQVHAGGRGKGGGVRIVRTRSELAAAASSLLGSQLVTPQTDAEGLPVNTLLVEALTDIQNEYYLSLLVDRARERITVMASSAGGMNIETVAAETPELILTTVVHPASGLLPYQGRRLGFALGLNKEQVGQFNALLAKLYTLFVRHDASLVEINPMVLTKGGDFLDVGGNATVHRVTQAFKLLLSDGSVEAVLVNIFGGIVRCDLIAEGVIDAVRDVHVRVPVVVRLAGTNEQRGREMLAASGLNIIAAAGLSDAADKAVKAAS